MKSKLLMLLVLLLMSFGVSQAADSVAVYVYDVANDVVLDPTTDTIFTLDAFAGTPLNYQLWIALENDINLGGMSLGFRLWSDDGVEWQYDAQAEGLGPSGPGTGKAAVTVITGSRMDPPGDVFDMTGLLINEKDVDGLVYDTVGFGGVSMMDSLALGPLEPMIALHFTPGGVDYPNTRTMCFDSAFVPPAAGWAYSTTGGSTFPPGIAQALCFPVKNPYFNDAENDKPVPHTFDLGQNYPNPFNPTTRITYSVARKTNLNISVFNILGQHVATLVDREVDAGPDEVLWDGNDATGDQVASGIYFYKMYTKDFVETRKMVLMR